MEFFQQNLSGMLLGIEEAFLLTNLGFVFIGVLLGTIVGVLPGIGPLTAISLILPITFYMNPTSALILLAGVWYGTAYGGSTAAILVNVPGTSAGAVTAIDGYPMAQKGRARRGAVHGHDLFVSGKHHRHHRDDAVLSNHCGLCA